MTRFLALMLGWGIAVRLVPKLPWKQVQLDEDQSQTKVDQSQSVEHNYNPGRNIRTNRNWCPLACHPLHLAPRGLDQLPYL